MAMPDPGSVEPVPIVAEGRRTRDPRWRSSARGPAQRPGADRRGIERARRLRGRSPRAGNPIAVFGPQTGYFAPQLVMEQDAHARRARGPAIHARGVAFVGTNLYVQLGRGMDYAWSATSAGNDIIDTYAVRLCNPDGSEPTRASTSYASRAGARRWTCSRRPTAGPRTSPTTRRPARRRCACTGPRSVWSPRPPPSRAGRTPTPSSARPTSTRSIPPARSRIGTAPRSSATRSPGRRPATRTT